MRAAHVCRIVCWHLALYLFVVFYILMGAAIFYHLESEAENARQLSQRTAIREFKSALLWKLVNQTTDEAEQALHEFMKNISTLTITVDDYLLYDDPKQTNVRRWTYSSSVLFAFTILTTIGYGNVAPTTHLCQIFFMVYATIGIPLFLISMADFSRFFKSLIMYWVQIIYKKEIKKQGERNLLREIGEVVLVAVIFLLFISVMSAVLPCWEQELTYFDSLYFSYMSLSTIGIGDIVPKHMEYLSFTLLYLTIGLCLTTALVEQLADVFRLVHYAGRHVSNVKGITVWLGGREISIGSLIQTICRRVGMSDNIINLINWDKTIESALNGESLPLHPVFPWHFTDFVERDPPLIDLSMDLDQEDMNYYVAERTICNSPAHKTWRKMSAPLAEMQRESAKHSLEVQ
ncbi:TWiK family of potassium channels protein 9 [Aphelenchoides besseyi]|nr:TWiK family of potassium channels protein 9 [Aphelenchoides besseyi]